MLIPIYKKKHKQINVKGTGKFLNKIKFGFYGIRTLEKGILLVKQLETIRLFVSRISKRVSKIFIRVFFIQPLTKKPLKSRMGKGVGIIKLWIAYVKKGTIFF
jgi:large subunit ribosomal protein L16